MSSIVHCIPALIKLVAQHGACPAPVIHLMQLLRQSVSLEIQQRASEFLCLLTLPEVIGTTLTHTLSHTQTYTLSHTYPVIDTILSHILHLLTLPEVIVTTLKHTLSYTDIHTLRHIPCHRHHPLTYPVPADTARGDCGHTL